MKEQYFGDINDYRKYGLLRTIVAETGMSLGVCWMKTENDGRTDGNFRSYLEKPDRYRRFDPDLFDTLTSGVKNAGERKISRAQSLHLLPQSIYLNDSISDALSPRAAYFGKAKEIFRDTPLLFFDPDNGIEVQSVKKENKRSSKYVYWDELEHFYRSGYSLIVYQHFPRVPHTEFTAKMKHEFRKRLPDCTMLSFMTPSVVYFFAVHRSRNINTKRLTDRINSVWGGEIIAER